MSRRKRSDMSLADARRAIDRFSTKIIRMGETSDASMFVGPIGQAPAFGPEHINVQLMVAGSFGAAEDFFEAIRVLAGHKLPRKEPKP